MKKIDMAEQWLREHDPEYFQFKKKKKDKEYPFLSEHQLERRARMEVAEYRDEMYNRTA